MSECKHELLELVEENGIPFGCDAINASFYSNSREKNSNK